MISVISTSHNQIGANKLYVESLRKYTVNKFELIVIDNISSDGTREFYEKNCDVLIKNDNNYSYPYCQNQGIAKAKYEYLAFLNNDIILSPGWDSKAIEIMEKEGIDYLSFASTDHLETLESTKKWQKKWRIVKYPLLKLFGSGKTSLWLMHKLFYGNWEKFNAKWEQKNKGKIITGFSGSCLMIKKTAFQKIENWDNRIQAADWDLFFKTIERSRKVGDTKPIQLALGIYIHHFQKLSFKAKHPQFIDKNNLISLEEKWGEAAVKEYEKLNFRY